MRVHYNFNEKRIAKQWVSRLWFYPQTSINSGKSKTDFENWTFYFSPKCLAQIVIFWKPEEVDMILIVVDADDDINNQSKIDLERAIHKIRDNHFRY